MLKEFFNFKNVYAVFETKIKSKPKIIAKIKMDPKKLNHDTLVTNLFSMSNKLLSTKVKRPLDMSKTDIINTINNAESKVKYLIRTKKKTQELTAANTTLKPTILHFLGLFKGRNLANDEDLATVERYILLQKTDLEIVTYIEKLDKDEDDETSKVDNKVEEVELSQAGKSALVAVTKGTIGLKKNIASMLNVEYNKNSILYVNNVEHKGKFVPQLDDSSKVSMEISWKYITFEFKGFDPIKLKYSIDRALSTYKTDILKKFSNKDLAVKLDESMLYDVVINKLNRNDTVMKTKPLQITEPKVTGVKICVHYNGGETKFKEIEKNTDVEAFLKSLGKEELLGKIKNMIENDSKFKKRLGYNLNTLVIKLKRRIDLTEAENLVKEYEEAAVAKNKANETQTDETTQEQ